MSAAGFYHAFEARYRGSRELIRERLEAYLPFVLPLLKVCDSASAIDLGCGRGEWLELLQEHGFVPQGVDLDAAMLEACYERGLPAVQGDAIAHLHSLQDASQCMVTGFHFAEHISFDELQTLVAQAMRVLQPGGLLILETPNPENIVVGATSFYLDPTHIRPIPPLLLAFLPEQQGFARVKVLRLQESSELATQADLGLMNVLSGVSPDYAVVAQKGTEPAAMDTFNAAFETQFGIELDELAHRYDDNLDRRMALLDRRLATSEAEAAPIAHRLAAAEAAIEQSKQRSSAWDERFVSVQSEVARIGQRVEASAGAVEYWKQQRNEWHERFAAVQSEVARIAQRLEASDTAIDHWKQQSKDWHERVVAVHESYSWKITGPLRELNLIVKAAGGFAREGLHRILAWAIRQVFRYPGLRRGLGRVTAKFPWLQNHLVGVAVDSGQLKPSELLTTGAVAAGARNSNAEDIGFLLRQGVYRGKRIAVLAPGAENAVPGGAERFYSGLVRSLRDQGCDVDLVCLPVDESSFEGIQRGYQSFLNLDLQAYDLVISTKGPSYAVKHPNHILYLVHTARVFYDMFEEAFPSPGPQILAQRAWVHQADSEAFSHIAKRFSIGVEVSRRLRQWNGIDAEVLHPPIDLSGLYDGGPGDYFFMPGRLHRWKRIDLAINAIKSSSLPLRLLISGTGEAEEALRRIAGNDARIEFLGRVDDEQLKALYAGALAVPFLPLREDYGYVTLEAFTAGKPVVTCTDSGEPTEFVENGVTGMVCPPDPQALCRAFEELWQDRALAAKLGQAGRARISAIQWPAVARRLLRAGFGNPSQRTQPLKVAILDMQPILPAVGGGRLRLLGLYHGLGPDMEARYVGTYDWPGEKYRKHLVSPTLQEINVPLSPEHHAAAAAAAKQAGGRVVIDMMFGRQAHLSPEYLAETIKAVEWADVVVFSHPWVRPLIDDALLLGKTVVYDAQNVEKTLREQILDKESAFQRTVLADVERAERQVGDRADLILVCAEDDAESFSRLYDWSRTRMVVVPNGVFGQAIKPASLEQKEEARRALRVDSDRTLAFFIGSDYAPNVEAAKVIIEQLARALPEVEFAIAGGVCARLPLAVPKNVRLVGLVDEEQKLRWLHASDIGLNPMCSGSGTNIKMFDFMAAALPIVCTAIGARGIAATSSNGIHIAEPHLLATEIGKLLATPEAIVIGGLENRAAVDRKFCWETISPDLGMRLRSAHFRKLGMNRLIGKNRSAAPRIAHLSTIGMKCGIGEYSRKIVDIYGGNGIANLLLTCESAVDSPVTTHDGTPSQVAWYYDNKSWQTSYIKQETIEKIVDWGATGVLIQYHPGFYSPSILLNFAKSCIAHGICVVLIVHNFTEQCAAAFKELNILGVLIFSHRDTEALEAREFGVSMEFIPVAVDILEPLRLRQIEGRDWREHPPIIITNGFLRKHKGVRHLIKAMPQILKEFPGAHLQVRCSLYPSDDSREELEACHREITINDLAQHVTLDTRFLPKSEMLAELAKADLAVLPYDQSNEGGSASATDAFAVGLPLVTSTAEIFDSIRGIVTSTTPSPDALAREISGVLSSPERYHSLALGSVMYAKENSWRNVAGTFLVGM